MWFFEVLLHVKTVQELGLPNISLYPERRVACPYEVVRFQS